MSATKVTQHPLAEHVFQTGVLLNGINAMHQPPSRAHRFQPAACTAETIADARLHQRLERLTVIAALAYDYCPEVWRGKASADAASYFDAPPEIQQRCDRIAGIFLGLLDPDRESLAWHAASRQTDPKEAVRMFLEVCRRTSEADRPDLIDPRRI